MKTKIIFVLTSISVLFSSCVFQNGLATNGNSQQTNVILSSNNFEVIDKVEGKASANYYFGIGEISKNGLISKAKSTMLDNAKLIGKSRTVINESTDVTTNKFLIFKKQTVTVSAYIIEFYNSADDVTKIVKIQNQDDINNN